MTNLGFTVRWATNTAELKKNLEDGLDQIEVTRSAVDKLVASIGGDKLLRSANAYAAALQKIGGEAGAIGAIEKLNSSERLRAIDILDKAIGKYEQLGKAAPSALRDLLAAARAVEKPIQDLAADTAAVQRQIDRFSGQRLTSEATAIAKAIQQIGGVSKLTADEQRQVTSTVSAALDKFRALGSEAPQALRDIYGSLVAIKKPAQDVAEAATAQQNSFLGLSQSRIDGFFGDLKTQVVGTAAGFVTAQAAIGAVQTGFRILKDFVVDSTVAYGEAEAASKRVTVALQQQGQATPEVIGLYSDLATQFQKTTVNGDDLVQQMEAILIQVGGVMPGAMERALQASSDLSAGLGIDLEQATNLVAKAAAGHTESLGRYGITVDKASLESRGFAAVLDEVNARFGGQAAAQLDTYAGKLQKIKNDWNNVEEAVGKAIVTNPIVQRTLSEVAKAAEHAGDEAGNYGENSEHAAFRVARLASSNGLAVEGFKAVASKASELADSLNEMEAAFRRAAAMPSPFKDWATATALPTPSLPSFAPIEKYNMALVDARQKVVDLVGVQREVALAALASGKSVSEATAIVERYWPEVGDASKAVDQLSESLKRGTAEQKKSKDQQAAWLKAVEDTTVKMNLSVFTLNRFGAAVPQSTSAIGANRDVLLQWRPELEGVTASVYDWGAAHEKTIAIIERQLQQLSLMPSRVKTAAESFREAPKSLKGFTDFLNKDLASILQQAFTGGGGIKGALQAAGTKLFGPDGPLGFGAKGALSGLTTKLTNIFGAGFGAALPGLGALIGPGISALVGKLTGWITGGPEWKKFQKDVGRDFGVAISDALAQALEKDSKQFGRQAAGLINLDQIIKADGGLSDATIGKFTAKLRDTFSLLGTGALSASQATSILDKNFQSFADAWLAKGPLISKELVEIVRLTRQSGVESNAVAGFIKSQIDSQILPGLRAFTDASKKATDGLGENKKKLADLNDQLGKSSDPQDQARLRKEIEATSAAIDKQQRLLAITGVTSQRSADALAGSVAVAFSEMQRNGTPILDIADKLSPIVGQLQSQFDAAGVSGGAAFDKIRNLVSLAADEISGPAVQSATGLGQALAGLSNIGGLDQSTFEGLSDQIASTFNELVAQGYDGTSVLTLMQQPLQTIFELASKFGFAVDEGTQALLDQAASAGVVGSQFMSAGDRTAASMERTNVILEAIAEKLGATVPAAVQNTVDALGKLPAATQAAGDRIKKDLGGSADAIDQAFAKLTGNVGDGASEMSDDAKAAFAVMIREMERQFEGLPDDVRDTAVLIGNELSKIRVPEIRIPITFEPPPNWDPTRNSGVAGGTTRTPDLPQYRSGSDGLQDFGAGTLAVLHGREAVVTESQFQQLQAPAEAPALVTSGDAMKIEIHFHGLINDGSSVRRAMDDYVIPELKGALVRDQGGIRRAVKNASTR